MCTIVFPEVAAKKLICSPSANTLNVTEVLVSDLKNAFPGIFNFTVGILVKNSYLFGTYESSSTRGVWAKIEKILFPTLCGNIEPFSRVSMLRKPFSVDIASQSGTVNVRQNIHFALNAPRWANENGEFCHSNGIHFEVRNAIPTKSIFLLLCS